jgi:hypothetical protein
MPIKQIKQKFQIASYDSISTQVTITANESVVFSGPLSQTLKTISFDNFNAPAVEVIFDLDIPLRTETEWENVSIPMELTCTGGDLVLQDTSANYSRLVSGDPSDPTTPISIPGTSTEYITCEIDSIPLLNGLEDSRHGTSSTPETYILMVKSGERTTFSVSVGLYNDD